LPPRRSLLRRRRRGCQSPRGGRFRARAGSLGRRWTHLHVWSRLGGSAGVYSGRCLPRGTSRYRQSAAREASTPDWSSTQGSVPAHAPASSDPQEPHRPAKTPVSPSRGPAARRALPETQSRKGTMPRTRQPPSRATERASLGRKHPGNRGANRPPSSSRERGFGSPRPTLTHTTSNSCLPFSPVGVAIVIGPSQKLGSSAPRVVWGPQPAYTHV
jgi:hypothetical protein